MRVLGLVVIVLFLVASALVALHHEDPPADPPQVVKMVDPIRDRGWTPTVPPTTSSTTTTTAKPIARARTAPISKPAPAVPSGDVWDRLAMCESGGRWDDTRGGYEGGLHFAPSTWRAAGGLRYAPHAYLATRAEQITVAVDWLRRTSWAQWPGCSRKLGLR